MVGMRKRSLMQTLVIDRKLGKKFHRPPADSVVRTATSLYVGSCLCTRQFKLARYSWLDYFYWSVYFWNGQTEHNCPVSIELNGVRAAARGGRAPHRTRCGPGPPTPTTTTHLSLCTLSRSAILGAGLIYSGCTQTLSRDEKALQCISRFHTTPFKTMTWCSPARRFSSLEIKQAPMFTQDLVWLSGVSPFVFLYLGSTHWATDGFV